MLLVLVTCIEAAKRGIRCFLNLCHQCNLLRLHMTSFLYRCLSALVLVLTGHMAWWLLEFQPLVVSVLLDWPIRFALVCGWTTVVWSLVVLAGNLLKDARQQN